MSSIPEDSETLVGPVGPFTGFGNFFRKELRDWWRSWRFLIILLVMTLITELIVFFSYHFTHDMLRHLQKPDELPSEQLFVTFAVLGTLQPGPGIILQILIIIFSTMGLLTVEKSSGTLAWSLTKPLGRTGLFVAKWLAATTMLWLAMCVVPVLISAITISAYYGFTPYFDKIAPIVGSAFAWIGLWVLLSLTISLGFRSQAAVAGILVAFWLVPYIFGALMGWALGEETMHWIVDRLATGSPFWAYHVLADDDLFLIGQRTYKNVYLYAFAVWMIVLSILSLRIFNRQEIET